MATNTFHIQLDNLLSQGAEKVLSVQREKMEHLLAQNGEKFILFGSGKLGQTALNGLRKVGITPLAFTDNSPVLWGKNIDGVDILSPNEAKQRFGHKAIFVITVYTSNPVRRQLEEMGVTFISFAELSWQYPQTLLPHYAMDLPHSIFFQADKVRQTMSVWEDDISRNEYLAQINWRISLNPSVLPNSNNPQQMYFQRDVFSFSPSDTIVDCGAFDGDTIREFRRQKISYRRLIAIEPDPINCQKLKEYLSTLPEDLRNKISVHQNAVGATKEKLNFEATGTARTSMDAGSYEVESIPLDEVLANEKPTYIKMDIEGAEYQALCGGRQTIEKSQPILAICLYHNPEDLWRIPLLIRSMSDNYRLFLRRYSDECWEQVCYAIPQER